MTEYAQTEPPHEIPLDVTLEAEAIARAVNILEYTGIGDSSVIDRFPRVWTRVALANIELARELRLRRESQ